MECSEDRRHEVDGLQFVVYFGNLSKIRGQERQIGDRVCSNERCGRKHYHVVVGNYT